MALQNTLDLPHLDTSLHPLSNANENRKSRPVVGLGMRATASLGRLHDASKGRTRMRDSANGSMEKLRERGRFSPVERINTTKFGNRQSRASQTRARRRSPRRQLSGAASRACLSSNADMNVHGALKLNSQLRREHTSQDGRPSHASRESICLAIVLIFRHWSNTPVEPSHGIVNCSHTHKTSWKLEKMPRRQEFLVAENKDTNVSILEPHEARASSSRTRRFAMSSKARRLRLSTRAHPPPLPIPFRRRRFFPT